MGERVINGIPFDANAIIDQEGEISYDYTLFAEDIAQWLSTYFGNGILVPKAALMTTQFQVSMINETQISINKGNIVINGRTGYLKNPYEMSVDYASAGKQRIDRIVIELNINETVNEFRPLVLKGVESEKNPQIPDITRDNYLGIYQMSLANVLVTADGIQNITDERNDSNLCGVSQVLIGVKPAVPVTGNSALNISYDNSYTGAAEETVQDALDNLYNTKKKIILDGVDQGELKLSTKYQWVDNSVDFLNNYNTLNKMLVGYKDELHLFLFRNSNNHYKIIDNSLVADVDCPIPPSSSSDYTRLFCSDDNYIYTVGRVADTDGITKLTFYRFDGSAWEKFFVLTPKSGNTESANAISIPSVHSNKLYITASMRYSSTNYYYAGYIDLDTLTWVDLPTLPTQSLYGKYFFTEIDNKLYIIEAPNSTNPYIWVLNNNNNSWTQVIYISTMSYYNYTFSITHNNKAYIFMGGALYCFDGSTVKIVSVTDALEYVTLAFAKKFYVHGVSYQWANSTSYAFKQVSAHKSLEKVLCLEE